MVTNRLWAAFSLLLANLLTGPLFAQQSFDIVIQGGRVVDATIRQSLNSSFDVLIVRSARTWKYRPAMKVGSPVRYRKTLILVP